MSDFPLNDIFYSSLEQARREELYNQRRDEIAAQQAQNRVNKIEEEKSKLLSDPSKIDAAVAEMSGALSPSLVAKPKFSKYAFKTDAVEDGKDSEDPTRGIGYVLRDQYTQALASPKNIGVSPEKLLSDVTGKMFLEGDENNKTLLEKTYEYKRRKDSEWFGSSTRNILGYDSWLQDKRANEAIENERKSLVATPGDIVKDAAIFAGISGAFGALSGGPAGAALGAITGGVAGAASAAFGIPLSRMIEKTEWYKTQSTSNSWIDRFQGGLVSALPEMLIGGLVESGLAKAAVKTAETTSNLLGKSTGEIVPDYVKGFFGTAEETVKPATVDAYRTVTMKYGERSSFAKLPSATSILNGAGFQKWQGVSTDMLESMRAVQTNPTATNILKATDSGAGVSKFPEFNLAMLRGAENPENLTPVMPVVKKFVNEEVGKLPGQSEVKLLGYDALPDHVFEKAITDPDGPAAGVAKALENHKAVVYVVHKNGRARAVEQSLFEARRQEKLASIIGDNVDVAGTKVDLGSIVSSAAETVKNTETGVASLKEFVKSPEEALMEKGLAEPSAAIPSLDSQETITTVIPRSTIAKEVSTLAGTAAKKGKKTFGFKTDTLLDWLGDDKDIIWALPDSAAARKPETLVKVTAKTRGLSPEEAERYLTNKYDSFVGKLETTEDLSMFKRIVSDTKAKKLALGLTAFGVGTGALDFFGSEDTAHAGVLSSVLSSAAERLATNEARIATMQALKDAGYAVGTIGKETDIAAVGFQRALLPKKAEFIKDFTSSIRKGVGSGSQFGIMSPGMAIDTIVKQEPGKMRNVAVYVASMMSSVNRNVDNAKRVVYNIMEESGLQSARKQVQEAMSPLVPLYVDKVRYDVGSARLGDLQKSIAKLTKKAGKLTAGSEEHSAILNDIELAKGEMSGIANDIAGLDKAPIEFDKAYQPVVQSLAQQHASVRVSLALDGMDRYPWLKDMLSYEDMVATGKFKKLLDDYKVRLDARGIKTISDDYLPHIPHPEFTDALYGRIADSEGLSGIAYSKFYSRTPESRSLMPDITSTLLYYTRDVEKRLGHFDLWEGPQGLKDLMYHPIVQSNYGLNRALRNMYEGTVPDANTWGNKLANGYTELEVFKRLFLNPSAGLKHIVKLTGDAVSIGPVKTFEAMLPAARHLIREGYNKLPESVQRLASTFGLDPGKLKYRLADDFTNSVIAGSRLRSYIMDLGIESQDALFDSAKQVMQRVQNIGGTWINLAELFDRSTSVASGITMAAKKGMTPEQALYGTYDLILRNNFLGSELNPRFLNNPKFRALMMFQATPFKIFERRLVNLYRTGKSLGELSSAIKSRVFPGLSPSANKEISARISKDGIDSVLSDFRDLSSWMRGNEIDMKSNIFYNSLWKETDFYGTPIFKQTFRDMALIGAATYAGHSVGLSLYHHFFHIPFLSTQTEEPTLAIAPGANAIIHGLNVYMNKENPDFVGTEIVRKWLGKSGPFPDIAGKIIRLNSNDIPEIYQKGGDKGYLRYFFAIPGYEK